MDQDATQLVQQRLSELPQDVRDAVQAADLGDKVRSIGARHALHIDQTGELEDETLLTMLGFSPMEQFGARLVQVLHVPSGMGDKLSAEVSAEIFSPIRESMKQFGVQRQQAAAPAAVSAKTPVSPDLHKADVMLTEKTLSLPAQAGVPVEKPIYKADPYREPV